MYAISLWFLQMLLLLSLWWPCSWLLVSCSLTSLLLLLMLSLLQLSIMNLCLLLSSIFSACYYNGCAFVLHSVSFYIESENPPRHKTTIYAAVPESEHL